MIAATVAQDHPSPSSVLPGAGAASNLDWSNRPVWQTGGVAPTGGRGHGTEDEGRGSLGIV